MGDIERLDASLASLAREEGALRLRLGQLLEVIGRGAVFDLGFSSLGAYAVERCERSVRWAEGARCLARRLEALPELRRAVALGKVSWSMAEALARVATPEDEGRWLELAQSRTVRQVRGLVAEAINTEREAASDEAARDLVAPAMNALHPVATSGTGAQALGLEGHAAAMGEGAPPAADDSLGDLESGEDICTLTCTVEREEAWLFEATRYLLEQFGERTAASQSEALLAEAHGTLLACLPESAIEELEGVQECGSAQRRWAEQLRRERDEAEGACEKGILHVLMSARGAAAGPAGPLAVALEAASGIASVQSVPCTLLDREVRALSAAMARHDLDLSRLVLRFHRAGGWGRLGYASETQYARERLGLSRSCLMARRKLALQLEKLPAVTAALGAAQLGVEAALQVVRIATPKTEVAWITRARARTLKHLREEVAAALTAVRLSGERDCLPPEDAEISAFQALEQAVVSGRLMPRRLPRVGRSSSSQRPSPKPPSEARRAWWVMLSSLSSWLDGGLQGSAAGPIGARVGRVTLRLRMSRETYTWWRGLETRALRWLPEGMSWLRFLCLCVWDAWGHLLGTEVAYGQVYIRDRFRCTVPVCDRRDVTPHHLRFRSAGGSDEPSNITSPCTWCHLHGVHGGRIRATGTAECIHWELGPRNSPCVVVHGRERMAA